MAKIDLVIKDYEDWLECKPKEIKQEIDDFGTIELDAEKNEFVITKDIDLISEKNQVVSISVDHAKKLYSILKDLFEE